MPLENPEAEPVFDLSLFEEPVDFASLDKLKRDAQPPAGQYLSIPTLDIKVYRGDDGRRVAMLSGLFTHADDGAEHRLRIRISPDRRDQRNDSGKPDMASRLWAQARDAFKQVTGVEPTTERQIFEYLQNYPIKVRTMQGEDSPITLSIRAIAA